MQNWRMNAVLNTDQKKYSENWDKIFNKNVVSTAKKRIKKSCELSSMADSDLSCGGIYKEDTE